jgi:hypothetical protein
MTGALRINALVLIARVLVRLWVRGFPALMRDFPAGRKANSADRGYFVKDAESLAGIKRIFVKLTGFLPPRGLHWRNAQISKFGITGRDSDLRQRFWFIWITCRVFRHVIILMRRAAARG